MTKTTYNGQTVDLIKSSEIDERLAAAADVMEPESWERFRRTTHGRMLTDLIHDCQVFVEHYEEAALIKARADGQKAVRAGLGEMLKDFAPDSLRKAGAL